MMSAATAITSQKREKKQKEEKEACPICADAYTAVIRRKIVCTFCEKDACSKCIEHYLLGRPEDAHCIHCRVNYSDTVLQSICTKTYLQQTYYRHRQEILIRRERVYLPGLQDEAQRMKRIRERIAEERILHQEYNALKTRRKELSLEHSEIYSAYLERKENGQTITEQMDRMKDIIEQVRVLCEEIAEKRRILRTMYRRRLFQDVGDEKGGDEKGGDENGGEEKGGEEKGGEEKKGGEEEKGGEKRKFIRRCMKANCQGFLSIAWKCGLCDHYSCSKCFSVKGAVQDAEHTCTTEDLATADMIRQNSKPCPNCGEFIEKTMGCSMMFCITCHTPWDWKTGRVVTKGAIHNPHYYEWLKRMGGGETPRNPADVPCGGFPDVHQLRAVNRCAGWRYAQYFYEFHRLCIDLQERTERAYRSHLDDDGMRRNHIYFLLGDFDEKEWGRRLARAEKKKKRDREIQEVFAAFRMVAVELINRIQNYRDSEYDAFTLLPKEKAGAYLATWNEEVQALVGMVNDGLRAVSIAHNCHVPYLFVSDGLHSIHYQVLSRKYVPATKKRGARKAPANDDDQDAEVDPSEDEEVEEEVEEEEEEVEEEEKEEEKDDDAVLELALAQSLAEK